MNPLKVALIKIRFTKNAVPDRGTHTLLFLRGLKYPLRVLAEKVDEEQYIVCPYCGDCFKIYTDNCPRCRRTLVQPEKY